MDLIVQGYDPTKVNELCGVIRRPIKWQTIEAPEGMRTWQGQVGDWHFALGDFSIENQTGRPGERGQNVGISNHTLGWVFMGESILLKQIAKYLVEHMRAEDQFTGRGGLTMDDEAGSEERMATGKLDLRFPADLRRAIEWQTKHCDAINEGGLWMMSGASLQLFKSQKRVVVVEGDLTQHSMHMGVRIAFLAMGWTIQESTPHDEETRIAERWAKRWQAGS